jgi:hypothetical protein
MPRRRSSGRQKGQPRRVADPSLLLKNTSADVASGERTLFDRVNKPRVLRSGLPVGAQRVHTSQ